MVYRQPRPSLADPSLGGNGCAEIPLKSVSQIKDQMLCFLLQKSHIEEEELSFHVAFALCQAYTKYLWGRWQSCHFTVKKTEALRC